MATILLLKRKLKEYEEWWLTQRQIRNIDHTIQYSFSQPICTMQNVSKCEPLWFTSNLFVQAAHDVDEIFSFTGFLSSTIACFDLLQHSPHALLSFLDDHIRIGDKLQILGERCSREHPHQLPVLARHWQHSRQKVIWLPPFSWIYSFLAIMNDVATTLADG